MKGQITSRQLKKIAQIYAACTVYNTMGCGTDSDMLTEDHKEKLSVYMNKQAERIAKGLPDSIFGFGELDDIIKFVIYERTDNKF